MKEPRLWVSNRNGNVFTVSASERHISQLMKTYAKGVRVKRLSASDWCAWAVGHDHRVYTYVVATDVPIRVPQTTYENQRWSPLSGFRSTNLLPTDRKAWSDEKGEVYLPKENIHRPSSHWDWEGDWFIDENLQGEICTDSGGWQYAVNFTGRWTAESCWNSCVRKRKWIRFCRFTATNTWARVSDMEVVERAECFIDLSVGGQLLPGQPQDFLSVWAITNSGQVYVRTGVCRECPEGKEWKLVHCPNHMGIINIAVGPTGLVWAVTWDGHAMVRTHVSRDAVYGLDWEVVPYPEESTRLMQVSVGRNSVWALGRDGKVWFRQGVNGDKLFWDATAATGTAWVLMVGEMDHIAVSANDQVFALGQDDEDKEIWFRTGITASEQGGKTWQRVILEENPDVFDPNSSGNLLSQASQLSLESPSDAFAMSDCFSGDPAAAFPKEITEKLMKDMLEDGTSVPIMPLLPPKGFDDSSESLTAQSFTQEMEVSSQPTTRGRVKSWQMVENAMQTNVCCDGCTDEALEVTENSHGEIVQGQARRNSEPIICIAPLSVTASTKLSKDDAGLHMVESKAKAGMTESAPQELGSSVDGGQVQEACKRGRRGDGDVTLIQKSSVLSDGIHAMQIMDNHKNKASGCILTESEVQRRGQTSPLDTATSLSQAIVRRLSSRDSDTNPGTLNISFHSDAFDSLDSAPSADDIINFVTDLISDEEDEDKREKDRDKRKADDPGQVSFQDMHDQNGDADSKLGDLPAIVPWISIGRSENFTGRISVETTPTVERESIPAMTLTISQPRYAWGWLAAGAFVVENTATVPWLTVSKGTDSNQQYIVPKLSRETRDGVLQQLKLRNKRETHSFSHLEHAIDKSTWVKKASMKVQWQGKTYDCTLELEQGVGEELDGTFTIQFKLKHKPKVLQMSLQEIHCVTMCDDHRMALYASEPDTLLQPLVLIATSEAELREWLGTLNVANRSLWRVNSPIAAGSVCSLTVPGHILIHTPDESRARPVEMMWGQHGGHMVSIETTPCGVIWAISFDQTPWVYNGGYGNAVSRELSEMSSNLREQVDYRTIRVFENQKWYPVVGYCSRGVFHNNFAWTTPKGKYVKSREDIKLPSSQWQWVSNWTVDFSTAGGVNNEGWQYSSRFDRPYHPQQGLRDSVRRRQWSRKCKLVTQGPWVSVGPPELSDISFQVDSPTSPTQPLVLWAIGDNGDVLCRTDVTLSQPMGKSWQHVTTKSDMAFRSVSVGGGYRVWAVAEDGSVWYRPGVAPFTPSGSCWIQVIPPPPGGAPLTSISAGGSAVWALDRGGNLWRREEITPTFPEGTRWAFVCNHVRKVSVGPKDQVWIVSEANFGRNKHSAGAIYRRLGITESTPSGTDWELLIGPGWHYVSIRGLMTPNK